MANIQQGMETAFPQYHVERDDSHREKEIQKMIQTINLWIYSYMRPGYCISKFEYNSSKYLVCQYIRCIAEFIGEVNATKIYEFVRRYAKPHKMHYYFYLGMSVRNFGLYTNCGHEGTHNSLKYFARKVTQQHCLKITVSSLSWKRERENNKNIERTGKKLQGNKKI